MTLADEPIDRRHDGGVGERDAQFFKPRGGLRELGTGEIELRDRRGVSRIRIVEALFREQLPAVQVPRAFQVRVGELQVGFTLADRRLCDLVRRLGLLDLLDDLPVFDLRNLLAATDAIAEAHADRDEPSAGLRHDLDRRGGDEISDNLEARRDGVSRDRRQFHGDRRAERGTHASAAAVGSTGSILRIHLGLRAIGGFTLGEEPFVVSDAGQRQDRHDDWNQQLAHIEVASALVGLDRPATAAGTGAAGAAGTA